MPNVAEAIAYSSLALGRSAVKGKVAPGPHSVGLPTCGLHAHHGCPYVCPPPEGLSAQARQPREDAEGSREDVTAARLRHASHRKKGFISFQICLDSAHTGRYVALHKALVRYVFGCGSGENCELLFEQFEYSFSNCARHGRPVPACCGNLPRLT